MSKRNDMVNVALSQLGYTEGYNNDTKYGDWYGLPNQPWCAMFVSWCGNEIGVLDEAFPRFAGCTTGFHEMEGWGITTNDHIIPEAGDLIFFEWDGDDDDYDHVGIVEYADESYVHTIEGNHTDSVERFRYSIDSPYIAGYAKPLYKDEPKPSNNQVKDFQTWLNTFDNVQIDVDGVFGYYTKKASIIALQTLLRDEYHQDISIDGIWGTETWNVCKVVGLVKGDNSNMVKLVKGMLISYNFTPLGFDTDFDEAMWYKVRDYQCYRGLVVDGIVGVCTLTVMFSYKIIHILLLSFLGLRRNPRPFFIL